MISIQYDTSFKITEPETESKLGTYIEEFDHLYISVETTEGFNQGRVNRHGLSGRYEYHSTKHDSDIFVQPAGINALEGDHFYLIYRNGFWYITNEVGKEPWEPDFGAFLRLKTTGTSNIWVEQYSLFHTFEISITELIKCETYLK